MWSSLDSARASLFDGNLGKRLKSSYKSGPMLNPPTDQSLVREAALWTSSIEACEIDNSPLAIFPFYHHGIG